MYGFARESRYMALDERANASRAPPARLARKFTLAGLHRPVWKDAAAAPAQAPTAPTAGLRWGTGALAARLTGGEGGGALKTGQSEEGCFRQGKKKDLVRSTEWQSHDALADTQASELAL
ncbi:unnamed protein product [Pleuronectes platessa]|uniref:Uncharacterized protein n=1 Tax=Pleuronectes platessa TaxID=8262 RepID=A0A9N7VGD0_PLEPL|nr:unnamed protein product [Pleuronectes platessa]